MVSTTCPAVVHGPAPYGRCTCYRRCLTCSRTMAATTYASHVCTYGYRTELLGNGYVRVDSPAQLVTLTFPDGRHHSGYRLPFAITQAIAKLYGGAA